MNYRLAEQLVELASVVAVIAGGFLISVPAGIVATGAVALYEVTGPRR